MRDAIVVVALTVFGAGQVATPEERAFNARLARDEPLAARMALADEIAQARAAIADSDVAARYTVMWLDAVKRVLAAAPASYLVASKLPWFERHDEAIAFSEPAGAWLLNYAHVYKLHDQHRDSASADAIAWIAATAGIPGECEGYVPCYAAVLDMLYGEYLRRHPQGAHVDDALTRIVASLKNAQELIDGPNGQQFFTAKKDCAELMKQLAPLEAALQQVNAATVVDAVERVHVLASKCEP